MREIKFRAKKYVVTKNNEPYLQNGWVYSNTLYQDDDGVYLLPDGISAESYHISEYDFRANSDCMEIMVAKIKPETLGQYTELKDKNGKEIYEGDIVINSLGDKYIVKMGFYDFCFPMSKLQLPNIEYREVIGNIYDNPELLEAQDD